MRTKIGPLSRAVFFVAMAAGCGGGHSDGGEASSVTYGAVTEAAPSGELNATATTEAPQLPLEVLSDGRVSAPAGVTLGLDSTDIPRARYLFVQCHRCGFYAAPEFEATQLPVPKAKASVRIAGGAWIDIVDNDPRIKLEAPERLYGGVNGGMYTIKFRLELDAAAKQKLVALPARNSVEFRFNGTDGETNGFRVLRVDFLAENNENLSKAAVENYGNRIWTEKHAPPASAAVVEAGKALWEGENLLNKSPLVSRKMRASCAACHMPDGRDLQYFNYSNNSIVQRSRFHGLSALQGEQIAAYIRQAQRSSLHIPQAAPWNPPYQPSEGLSCRTAQSGCRPVFEWAAGGGLGAVVSDPLQALAAALGKSRSTPLTVTQADVDAFMSVDPQATLDMRGRPVDIQFPDWNAWLPSIHPMDIWGDALLNKTDGPFARYQRLRDQLTKKQKQYGDWSHLTSAERGEFSANFNAFTSSAWNFLGGGRGNRLNLPYVSGAVIGAKALMGRTDAAKKTGRAFTLHSFVERADMSLMHWTIVKEWELAHTFGLESDFAGSYDATTGVWTPDPKNLGRSWPFLVHSVFQVGPHMLAQDEPLGKNVIECRDLPTDAFQECRETRQNVYAWEMGNMMASFYRTNQWYQLQTVLNAGYSGHGPMDWPYMSVFVKDIRSKITEQSDDANKARMASRVRQLLDKVREAQWSITTAELNKPDPLYPADLTKNSGRGSIAIQLKQLTPTQYMDGDGTPKSSTPLEDQLYPGLHLMLVNGAIKLFNDVYTATEPARWRRCVCDPIYFGAPELEHGQRFCVPTTRRQMNVLRSGYPFLAGGGMNTDDQVNQYGIYKATQMGADKTRVERWSAWVDRMWPRPAGWVERKYPLPPSSVLQVQALCPQ